MEDKSPHDAFQKKKKKKKKKITLEKAKRRHKTLQPYSLLEYILMLFVLILTKLAMAHHRLRILVVL